MQKDPRQNSHTTARFVELDALRGIAALMVVFFHFAQLTKTLHSPHSLTIMLLRPILAGHEAVILFFLLSGFVLSLSTWRGTPLPYGDYLVRRIFRIYVPYLAALAIAVIACAAMRHVRPTVIGRFRPFPLPVSLGSIVQHVLFLGDYDMVRYNQPFWTLVVEMRISLLFPFVCLALSRMKTSTAALIAVGLSLSATLLTARFPGYWTRYPGGWLSNIHYLGFFILGALLARRLSGQPWPTIPPAIRHAMIPVAVFVFGYSALLARLIPHWPVNVREMMLDWPVALAGLALIYLAATHHTVKRTLSHFIPRYLGHISYSLYLMHNIVLSALRIPLYQRVSNFGLFWIYIVTALAASIAFYRLVELPAMNIGRRLTKPRRPRRTAESILEQTLTLR